MFFPLINMTFVFLFAILIAYYNSTNDNVYDV